MRLKDKVAIVTGGSSSIGRESALLFARERAKVAVTNIDTIGGGETVALEYGKYGIRVNAIAPGVIDTKIIDGRKADERKWPIISRANALGRIGQPKEVANAVLFLASDEASFITGSTLSVDGGGLTF